MKTVYQVQIPCDYTLEKWFTLATCESPEKAAEVVRILLSNIANGCEYLRVKLETITSV